MDAKEIISEVSEKIGRTANVKAAFGEPVREGNDVIIPVARIVARGGGGGGSGVMAESKGMPGSGTGNGMGMGINIVSQPVGYIDMSNETPKFVPIVDKTRLMLGGMAVLGMALLVVKTGLRVAGRQHHRKEMALAHK